MSHSPTQSSRLSSIDGSGTSMNKRKSKIKEKKSDTGSINENGGKRIINIGLPENFQHVCHIGWGPQGGFDVNNGEMKKLLDLVGVTEGQKQKEIMDLISEFVEKRGGLENATRQIELKRKNGPVAPVNDGNITHSQSQTSLSSMEGSGSCMNRRKSKERKENKNDTGSINENGGKRIITIGKPENVQHVCHIGWGPQGGFDVDKGEMKKLLDLVGVAEGQKQKEIMDLISEFVEKREGVENATRQIEFERKGGLIALESEEELSGSQWRLNFEPLQKANAELKRQCAELKKRIILQGRVLIRRTHRFAECQMKFEQKNKDLEKEIKQERTKREQSEQKVRELQQIKLEEEIREQENKLKDATELDRYDMGEGPRGICLVINNYNFLGEDERQGAKLDQEAIACLFNDLHFIVEVRQNLGGLEILKAAQELAAKDHSNYAAFVFCIMSHGDKKDAIYGVDNRKAGMEDLMSEFTATNCPTLKNKPKLFFIQACRGQRSDLRMNQLSASTADNVAEDRIQIMHSPDADLANGVSPREADFLLAFATVPGYKAWRSKLAGSWFIQVLVDVIRMYHRHHHLLDMLTEVNKQVADIANEYPCVNLSFQVPAPTHTLRAQVFL